MHAAFGTVLWIVCGVAAIGAIAALLMSGSTWSELGRNSLVMDKDKPSSTPRAATTAERDEEIREMLAARNARRIRRGEDPIDIDAELARLTAPGAAGRAPEGIGPDPAAVPDVDPELAAEIRQLVEARNARRRRAGKPPLDVEAEVARELRRVAEGFG